MNYQPPRKRGTHLIAVTVQGLTVDPSSGAFIYAGTNNFLIDADEIDHQIEMEFLGVRPVNSIQANEFVVSAGHVGSITELCRSDSAALISILISGGYTHCILAWTEGTETWTGYFLIGRYYGGMKGKGAQRKRLELRPVDPVTQAQMILSGS